MTFISSPRGSRCASICDSRASKSNIGPDPYMGSFESNLTFVGRNLNDRLWVGFRHGSDQAANGGFAPLLENCCHSAIDPITVVRPPASGEGGIASRHS